MAPQCPQSKGFTLLCSSVSLQKCPSSLTTTSLAPAFHGGWARPKPPPRLSVLTPRNPHIGPLLLLRCLPMFTFSFPLTFGYSIVPILFRPNSVSPSSLPPVLIQAPRVPLPLCIPALTLNHTAALLCCNPGTLAQDSSTE